MSREELTRLRVLIDVADGRLSVVDATGLIGVGQRQIYRLLDAFRARGAAGLISRAEFNYTIEHCAACPAEPAVFCVSMKKIRWSI